MTTPETSTRSGWQPAEQAGPPRSVAACLLDLARQDGAELFAIIDGARDDRLYREISRGEVPYEPLYRGETEKFFAVSPILAPCKEGTQIFSWLTTEAWGRGQALFITSRHPLERLAEHFARFTVVRTEDSEKLFFRFYDPRVLQVYLPACSPDERELLFGPAVCLATEADNGAGLLLFDREGGGLGPVKEPPPLPPVEPLISPAQMQVFSDYMLRQFVDAMVVSLGAAYPAQSEELGEEKLRALIDDGIVRARKHGVLLERDVERYLQCLVRHGEEFGQSEETAWANEILTTQAVTGTAKMDRIQAREAQLSAE